jgi:hypothetical protein
LFLGRRLQVKCSQLSKKQLISFVRKYFLYFDWKIPSLGEQNHPCYWKADPKKLCYKDPVRKSKSKTNSRGKAAFLIVASEPGPNSSQKLTGVFKSSKFCLSPWIIDILYEAAQCICKPILSRYMLSFWGIIVKKATKLCVNRKNAGKQKFGLFYRSVFQT